MEYIIKEVSAMLIHLLKRSGAAAASDSAEVAGHVEEDSEE
jgi:hypothetical protein